MEPRLERFCFTVVFIFTKFFFISDSLSSTLTAFSIQAYPRYLAPCDSLQRFR